MAKIEKADAAERLIVCAIRMVDRGDEPLASHLLATSALNVLRDLMRQSNIEYVEEVSKRGMFWLAEARAKGEAVNRELPEWIETQVGELAEHIKAGRVSRPDELTFNHAKPWKLLAYLMSPSNFLKHADRDPMATLDEADIDPVAAIGHALSAFSILLPHRPMTEETATFMLKHKIL